MTQTQTAPLDPKDLKIEVLRQRLAEVVVTYEDKDADKRVQIHYLSEENQRLNRELESLKDENRKEDEESTE